jgi:hypothetical protein
MKGFLFSLIAILSIAAIALSILFYKERANHKLYLSLYEEIASKHSKDKFVFFFSENSCDECVDAEIGKLDHLKYPVYEVKTNQEQISSILEISRSGQCSYSIGIGIPL